MWREPDGPRIGGGVEHEQRTSRLGDGVRQAFAEAQHGEHRRFVCSAGARDAIATGRVIDEAHDAEDGMPQRRDRADDLAENGRELELARDGAREIGGPAQPLPALRHPAEVGGVANGDRGHAAERFRESDLARRPAAPRAAHAEQRAEHGVAHEEWHPEARRDPLVLEPRTVHEARVVERVDDDDRSPRHDDRAGDSFVRAERSCRLEVGALVPRLCRQRLHAGEGIAEPDPHDVDAGQRPRGVGEVIEYVTEIEAAGEDAARGDQTVLLGDERGDVALHAACHAHRHRVDENPEHDARQRGHDQQTERDDEQASLPERDFDRADRLGGDDNRGGADGNVPVPPVLGLRVDDDHRRHAPRAHVQDAHRHDVGRARELADHSGGVGAGQPGREPRGARVGLAMERVVLERKEGDRKPEADEDADGERERPQTGAEAIA